MSDENLSGSIPCTDVGVSRFDEVADRSLGGLDIDDEDDEGLGEDDA